MVIFCLPKNTGLPACDLLRAHRIPIISYPVTPAPDDPDSEWIVNIPEGRSILDLICEMARRQVLCVGVDRSGRDWIDRGVFAGAPIGATVEIAGKTLCVIVGFPVDDYHGRNFNGDRVVGTHMTPHAIEIPGCWVKIIAAPVRRG